MHFLKLPAVLAILALVCPAAFAVDPDIHEGDVVVVPLEGPVTSAQFAFLRRVLKNAEEAKASAFVLDMDTPGGELGVTQKIVGLLSKATIPTYTWVNPNAASAGALIALGTRHVYMAPISAIGAAAPVLGSGEDIPETMKLKATSYSSAYFRGVASQNGYNPNLVDAFMDADKEFKIGDDVISPAGSLLTLNAQEAVRDYDGKRLLADGVADTLDQLKQQAGLTGRTVEIQPSGFERLALLITTLAPLFLLGGIIAAYIEFKTPGFGVAGVLSLTCFAIFFLGHHLAGLTGMEVAAVFVLGLVLVFVEVFFFPGIFVMAALGIILMLGAILFAMVDHFPGDPVLPDPSQLAMPALNLAIAIAAAIVGISLLARFFPSLPVFRRLVLSTASPVGPAIEPATTAQPVVQVGDVGTARTILRPAGSAEFDSCPVDVVTDGEFIEAGTKVRVVSVSGARVVVAAD